MILWLLIFAVLVFNAYREHKKDFVEKFPWTIAFIVFMAATIALTALNSHHTVPHD
jgi:hypothetical protein